jgi:predicted transcriptional regulator
MKKGEGEVQKKINTLLREKARTTEELADILDSNRQYIRKVLRGLVKSGKVETKGVASPKGGLTYKRKR